MYRVDHFPEYAPFRRQLLESLQGVDGVHFLSYQVCQVLSLPPVDLVDPYGIQELEEQEVAQIGLLLGLLRLIYVGAQHRLLEGLLHDEVLRYFLQQVPQVPLFLHVVLEEEEVVLVQGGSQADLVQQIVQLATVSLTDQHILPNQQ